MKARQRVGTPGKRPHAPYCSRKSMKRALGLRSSGGRTYRYAIKTDQQGHRYIDGHLISKGAR